METTVQGKFKEYLRFLFKKHFSSRGFKNSLKPEILTKIRTSLMNEPKKIILKLQNTATDFSMHSFELVQFSLSSPVKNIKKVKFKPYNFLSLCSSLFPKKYSFSSDSKPTNTTNHVFSKNFSFILFSLQFFVPCVMKSQLLRFPSSLSIFVELFLYSSSINAF